MLLHMRLRSRQLHLASKKWEQKFERNVTRDQSNAEALERLGWRVLVVWECETKGQESLEAKLQALLSS